MAAKRSRKQSQRLIIKTGLIFQDNVVFMVSAEEVVDAESQSGPGSDRVGQTKEGKRRQEEDGGDDQGRFLHRPSVRRGALR